MVIYTRSTQLNVRTTPVLVHEIDLIVDRGMFRSRSEAVNEALRLLIRRYKVMKIADQIQTVAADLPEGTDLSEMLRSAREEDDA